MTEDMYEVPGARLRELTDNIRRLQKEPHLEHATTRELLAELELRMQEWPTEMRAARAFIRGTVQATNDAAERTHGLIDAALDRRRS